MNHRLSLAMQALACTHVLVQAYAHAESDDPIFVAYEASAGCPGAAEFSSKLAGARRFIVTSTQAGETLDAQAVHVKLQQTEVATAEATYLNANAPLHRKLDAATCDEAASAMALTLRLAFGKAPPVEVHPRTPETRPAPKVQPPAHWYIGGETGAVGLFRGYDLMPALGFVIERSPSAPTFIGLSQPALRLDVVGATNRWVSSETQPIVDSFSLFFSACPLSFRPKRPRPFVVWACGAAAAGRILALGRTLDGVTFGQKQSAPWVALGAQLQLKYQITDGVEADLVGGVYRPLHTARFVYEDPESDAARMLAAVFRLLVGVTFKFR